MTEINRVNGTTEYEWDAAGNPTSNTSTSTYQVSPGNLLMQADAFSYTYDAEGNRTTKTNLANGQVTHYDGDHRNRLVDVTVSDGNGSPLSAIDYVHEILDHRISACFAAAEISRGEITPVTSTDAANCRRASRATGGTASSGIEPAVPPET